MQELNIFLFQALNDLSVNHIVATIAPLLADLPIFFLPIFLVWMWVYYTYATNPSSKQQIDGKNNLLFIFYTTIIAIIISLIIQQFVDIDRPETAITSAWSLLLSHIPDASFPSDHASVSVAFLVALFFSGYKKIFWSFLPWVILMNISRVISGVHWPFDILAGSVVGIVSAFISRAHVKENKLAWKLNSFIIKLLSYMKL